MIQSSDIQKPVNIEYNCSIPKPHLRIITIIEDRFAQRNEGRVRGMQRKYTFLMGKSSRYNKNE